jgi:catechol 2,3-dioxygenase-like lactoylglutathione lyase family enzyme
MTIQLNHTIVWCRDREASAAFLASILGLPPARQWGPFSIVEPANGVSLDFHPTDGPIASQHYAFLVSEDEFDAIFARIEERGLSYWGGPEHRMPGQINHHDGGRGVYWDDPDGHALEIITRPYGSGG